MDPQGSPLPATTDVRRNVSRRIAGAYFLFAGAWIVISDLALLELTSDLPDFAGASLVKGGLFVLVTTVLLYLFSSQQLRTITESGPSLTAADTPRLARLNPAVVFGAMAVLAIALVITMFSYESDKYRDAAREQLRAILELKADQIELLLEQRQAAARSYSRSRGLRADMTRHALRPDENIGQGIKDRIEDLRRDLAFDAVLVLDRTGLLVAGSASDALREPSPEIVAQAKRSMASGTPISHYLHRDTQLPDEPVLLDYITPLPATAGSREMLGVIVLRENARNRLFHLVQEWPTSSPTAESLLVRRDGDAVLFLNDVRHAKDTAFRLRRPLSHTDLVAAQAVQATATLLTDGTDYRGTRVVAASRGIAGTDWFLIAKVDRDEVLAPVRRSALIWLSSILCMSLLAAIGVWWLWRQQLRLAAANRQAETTAREALGKHLDLLSRHASDAILLVDMQGQIIEANERAVERYGYPREELIGMPAARLRSPEETSSLSDRFAGIRQHGSGLHESLHITRDGMAFPVEINAHLVDVGGSQFVQAIIRDITESKRSAGRIARLTHLRDMAREVNRAIVHVTSEDALFTETCATAVRHGGFTLAWIGMIDKKSGAILPLASAGDRAGLEYLSRIKVSYHDVPEGYGPTGTAVREGRMIVANDLLEDPRSAPWHEAAHAAGIRSSAALPLRRSGEVVAVLNVYAKSVDYFDTEIATLLGELAADVSFALDVHAGNRQHICAQQEAEYKNLVLSTQQQTSPDGILVVDGNAKIVSCNRQFLDLWGISAELARSGVDEPVLQTVASRMQDPDGFSRRVKYIYDNKADESNDELITKDGRIVDRHSAPVIGPNEEYFGRVWYFRDITERKRAEKTLRESEEKLRLFIDHAPSAIAMFDRDMRYIAFSRRWLTDYNLGDQDITGRSHYEVFPGLPERWKIIHRQCIAGAIEKAEEDSFQRSDGSVDWLRWEIHPWNSHDGGIGGIIIFSEVITARRQAEEALRTSQQIIEGILNAIPVRVFWKDRNLVYMGCNANFALDAGFTDPRDVIGKDDYQMGWRDQAELYRADDRQVIESGRAKSLIEEPQTTPEGSTITLLTSKSPLRNSKGEISGVLGTYMDITERKRAETAGRERLDRVQRQMDAIGRVSTSAALLTGDVERLAREITEEAARVAAVERANVWLFNENETELRCIDLYETTPGTHTAGAILRQENFENEFRALKNARYVDADDPLTDPRTVGYIEGYLKPLRITSMLDAVVQISGKNLGLLCLEHVDQPHHWEQDEIAFACQLADKIGLAITSRTRLQALESMEESERRFRSMVEQSISGFYLIKDGKFAYANSRFAEIFGYASPDEIVGMRPADLTAEKDRATVAENIRRRLTGEVKSIAYSFTGLRKDGSEIEIGAHGSYAIHEGRPAIIGLLQDISERKHAEDEIRHYTTRLEQAMYGTIGVITAIGEARDPYTRGHERRVGEIAAAIGAEMGLDADRVEGIRIAGYMHDVGKIGVPAEILSKPGKLTKIEYELVKGHAERGYEILKSIQFPWPVAEIAWQHHERLDGSGYPRGLKGDEILLDARILAVADTVEAMSSHRPYRPGMGIETALAEISKGAGKLYDQQAVDACLRLFRDKGYRLPE